MPSSILELIQAYSNFNENLSKPEYWLYFQGERIGRISNEVLGLVNSRNDSFMRKRDDSCVDLILLDNSSPADLTKLFEDAIVIPLRDGGGGTDGSTAIRNHVSSLLTKGWRGERYSVYASNGKVLFDIERAAVGLFGIRTYGCHMNGYIIDSKDGSIKMWIAKRSLTKQTDPGMLDNVAAGGLSSGYNVLDTMIKEAEEEAGIPPEIAKKGLKPIGCISYYQVRDCGIESEPGTDYCYDLCLPSSFTPVPADGEVDSFQLLPLDNVLALILDGKFKAESMLVTVDFMIRHSFLTPANCPFYSEICAGLRVASVSSFSTRPNCESL